MTNQSNRLKVLIVEDEIILAQDLANRLSRSYQVVDVVDNYDDALIRLNGHDIDIVLLDIMIKGDKDGIDIAIYIDKHKPLPYIFLSSLHDRDTVNRVKDVSPYAYLLKPYNDREIFIAIELALVNFAMNVKNQAKTNSQAESSAVVQIKDSLFLKKNNCFERVKLEDIMLLEADNNYTTVYTKSNNYIYSTVLKKMEEKLPSDRFIRVHRSYVINIQAVNGFEGNALSIQDRKVPVSKQYREMVFNLFKAF